MKNMICQCGHKKCYHERSTFKIQDGSEQTITRCRIGHEFIFRLLGKPCECANYIEVK